MFAQSIQVPTQGYTYTTAFNPAESGILGWNGQPVITNAILQNELMGRINSIGSGDFFGITNQLPVHYAINNGLSLVQPTLGLGGLGYNNLAPWMLGYGMHPISALHAGQLGGYGLNATNQFGGTNYGFGGFGNHGIAGNGFGLIAVIDNDTEVVFELALPGVTAAQVDVNVVNGEIRVRLANGTSAARTTAGSRTSGSATSSRSMPAYSLPLPSFSDANKVTAKVVQGRLTITCPRTAEYVKNITRVKVS